MINILEFKNYLNCDNVFLESIIQKFIKEVSEITEIIKESAEKEEWTTVKLNAHKMLSSVKIFEMNELTVLLEEIEINADTKTNMLQLKADVKKLIPLVKKVVLDMQIALEELN